MILKLSILAKEGISIDSIREATPEKVVLLPEHVSEENVRKVLPKLNTIAENETNN